ncbi:ANTAR domain-containing response regulator [Thalassotalea eurytherma]|uniref:Two-component system response regulator n=1 Tax=Thalassotalea eurytherma TaxID=1144278 RepID=A0ABQ6H503_9GAMM|nr:ANTAR domain-containing protein [Thalassotalea eurytherma]GLX81835.1 two-component system response regulator [Thalassotalea eurytherma]
MEAKTIISPLAFCVIYQSEDRAQQVEKAVVNLGFNNLGAMSLNSVNASSIPQSVQLIILVVDQVDDSVLTVIEQLSTRQTFAVTIFSDKKTTISPGHLAVRGVNCVIEEVLPIDRLGSILSNAHARFLVLNKLKKDLDKTKQKLGSVKTVEQAKLSLMRANNMSEDEAYQLIRKTAMNNSQTIEDVARNIIALEQVLVSHEK